MALAARVLPVCPPEKSVTTQDSNTAHEQAQLQAGTKSFQPSSPCCYSQLRTQCVMCFRGSSGSILWNDSSFLRLEPNPCIHPISQLMLCSTNILQHAVALGLQCSDHTFSRCLRKFHTQFLCPWRCLWGQPRLRSAPSSL